MSLAQSGRVLIVGHRGSSGSAPENTLAAFRKAIDDGADGIEFDVRLTKDGELVVLHDQTVNRTTNGRGNVRNLSREQVRHLDAGAWFAPEFRGQRIPTLIEVLHSLPRTILLNIEVKTDGQLRERMRLGTLLARMLREERRLDRTVVSSFDHTFLKQLRSFAPEIQIGALYLRARDFRKKPSKLCGRIGAAAFICSVAQLNKRIAGDVLNAGLTLACYGVNDVADVRKCSVHGATVLITDYPAEIKRMVSGF